MLKSNKLICTLTAALVGMSTSYFSNAQACPKNYCVFPVQSQCACPKHFFVIFGSGYSYSRNPDIKVPGIGPFWDFSPQGYNGNLGNAALYTAGAGYQFSRLLAVDFEVTRRQEYNYSKYQTAINLDTINFLGDKTRYFDVANTTIMLNTYLYGSGANLFANLDRCTILQPFLGAGIGIAYNTVSNFHTVTTESAGAGQLLAGSIMSSKTSSAFAWQVVAGIEVLHAETLGIDVGYRYYDGGQFRTNNYLINTESITTAPAWRGNLTANEVFINIKYKLA